MILTATGLVREPANPVEAELECQLTEFEPLPLSAEYIEMMDIAARMSAGCSWTEYTALEVRLSELLATIYCGEQQ